MSWGMIKKAINSTVGTSVFKPLDKMLEDMVCIAPSDNVKIDLSRTVTLGKGVEKIYTNKCNISGIIRIKASASWSSSKVFNLYYTQNDSDIWTNIIGNGGGGSTRSIDIHIKKGDVLRFKYATTQSDYVSTITVNMAMCGDTYLSAPNGILS